MWCRSRGAPFQEDLSRAIQNTLEGGLVAFWMDDVIKGYVREERKRRGKDVAGTHQLSFTTVRELYVWPHHSGLVMLG